MATDPKQKKTTRCFVYTRVSTEEQLRAGFDSLESQENSCKHFIQAREPEGWVYVKTYSDTATGANINRPGLQALLQDIRDGHVDQIVTYKIDRLSRSIADFYDLWRQFEELKVQLACSTQSIDTSDGTGRLMLNILLSFAQFEREINSQRVRDKREQSLKAGFWQGGWVPFGFDHVKSQKHERMMLVPHPKESEAIRIIFDHFLKTGSQATVKDLINSMGYRTKERLQKSKEKDTRRVGGKRFDEDDITRILKNRVYIGELYDEKTQTVYDGQHEPIISDKAIWVKAQEILNEKAVERKGNQKGIKPYRDKYVFFLKGLVHCSDCNSTMTTSFSGKVSAGKLPYLYYTCTDVNEAGQASTCSIRSLPARPLEDLIIEATVNLAKNPSLIEETIKSAQMKAKKEIGPIEKELAQYLTRRANIETQLSRLLQLTVAKGVEALSQVARKELEGLDQEKRVVDSEVFRLQRAQADRKDRLINLEIVHRSLSHFAEVVDKMTLEEKKMYCQALIERVDVYPWDPTEKEKSPPKKISKEGLLNPEPKLKTKNKWYRLKIRYRELPDVSTSSGGGGSSLGLHRLGSASKIRTCDRSVTVCSAVFTAAWTISSPYHFVI
ncbi:MAG: hypothetical protein COV45_05190 [Deltaproteobacteria bacterium CG11_big_fil_rev_8_21_14_0_20_47_16]|nr:MAG: hypothetical protein COV45_05190 [Deltaproteobacteria bacterium CG11_big_fil_rev_8_21_14_0_20_47_16]